ncbi:MAG: TatD family hydrolase, partial [Paraprevotella sp.]|nr:TatD family hydrolase [Paraprevotella sp.]
MKIIDTHAHLYDEAFAEDLDEVVARAQGNGLEKIFLPNIDEHTVSGMMSLCERWPGFFYPMLGLHPTEVGAGYDAVLDRMERLLTDSHPFIGIGEVGLDYYWDRTYYKEQQTAFVRQVEWAVAYGLPLMIHSRSAQKELVDLLTPYKSKGLRGVFHSFGGSWDDTVELLSFEGFMLGVNGVLTFKKSTLPEVLRQIPLERVVLETDAPYLAPV